MSQRRNRRKTRVVSDHAILALHKYYLRAEYMRMEASKARDSLVTKHGTESLKIRIPSMERFRLEMYIDYWYAGIFAVMEGYEKLALSDPEVESQRINPLYAKLREYRGGVYHFREKYFDDTIRYFLGDVKSGKWMGTLDMALGHFLLAEIKRRKLIREKLT